MPLHLHAYYRTTYGYEPDDFPVATAEFEREISLPIHSTMSDVEVARVIDAVVELVSESGP
jgi:perosamine synthetase